MEMPNALPLGLTFDDVLLLPGFSDFTRADITLSTHITKTLQLSLPFISSPMDTVTESELAIALASLGGISIIHRNLSIAAQVAEVKKVKNKRLFVGVAVGVSKGFEDRVQQLIEANVDLIVVDSAHGFAKPIIETVQWIKKTYPNTQVMAGNIATYAAAVGLIDAGADALRVGMGPGAICTTRIISGMGVPQLTAIQETVRATKGKNIPVIADGGIKYSGDIVKALAAGASAVMMGSFFASTEESPGRVVTLSVEQVPQRFRSIFKDGKKEYKFKEYRGMGSVGAMEKGSEVKAGDEYHGKDYYKEKVLVAEGVEGLIPIKGTVKEIVDQAIGGIKSGLYYIGAKSIPELWKKAQFIQITQASLTESHPHDILITNPGENY